MKTNKLILYHGVVALAAIALVAGTGSLIGSNMGFKAVRTFTFNAAPVARNAFPIALPHNNPWRGSVGFDSDNFLTAICNGLGGPYTGISLTRYDNAAALFVTRAVSAKGCALFTGTAFEFNPGEAYDIGLSGKSITGAVLVGSQDPTYPPTGTTFTFNAAPAARNAFPISITPNSKWANADTLLTAVCNGTGGPYTGISLTRYDNATALFVTRAVSAKGCALFTGTAFSLTPFEGYELGLAGKSVTRIQEPYY